MKTNILKKASHLFKAVNYCLASAEVYLHEAQRH